MWISTRNGSLLKTCEHTPPNREDFLYQSPVFALNTDSLTLQPTAAAFIEFTARSIDALARRSSFQTLTISTDILDVGTIVPYKKQLSTQLDQSNQWIRVGKPYSTAEFPSVLAFPASDPLYATLQVEVSNVGASYDLAPFLESIHPLVGLSLKEFEFQIPRVVDYDYLSKHTFLDSHSVFFNYRAKIFDPTIETLPVFSSTSKSTSGTATSIAHTRLDWLDLTQIYHNGRVYRSLDRQLGVPLEGFIINSEYLHLFDLS
ncbi:hypothetical protein [Chroococcidiopsis sp.]|uniref:hypothetical protein n=1 Tax=Chroococcidiopsis sp. TaxID=3088168 RepID=UPI003F2F2951